VKNLESGEQQAVALNTESLLEAIQTMR